MLLLGKVSVTLTAAREPDLVVDEVGPMVDGDIIPDEELVEKLNPEAPRTDKRFESESSRTQVVGDNP